MNKFLKVLLIMLCAVVLVVLSVAGTLAYLSTKTDPVTNTFTAGDINITLSQTATLTDAKIIPGQEYVVDPVVTVAAGSEGCWLFIEVDKMTGFDTYFNYTPADGWNQLNGNPNVYWRTVSATAGQAASFALFAPRSENTQATLCASMNLTKEQCKDLSGSLSFTAYAVQHSGVSSETDAWRIAQGLNPEANQNSGEQNGDAVQPSGDDNGNLTP